jgi:hypothetical protein
VYYLLDAFALAIQHYPIHRDVIKYDAVGKKRYMDDAPLAHLQPAWRHPCLLLVHPEIGADQVAACGALEAMLDTAFPDWLRSHYAPLGAQRLPVPRHVFHVPHYLDYRRGQPQGAAQSLALLVLDGMSLADWVTIGGVWRARHPNWRFTEHLLLAQIPTITAVSRRALISGLRPADFASPLDASASEGSQWLAFWAQRDIPSSACLTLGLALDRGDPPPAIEDHRIRALCLVDDAVDELTHSAGLGAAEHQASLKLWLESSEGAYKLEQVIAGRLGRGFSVTIASDHGHVEARGMGRPSEGLTVTTKGQRARVYADRRAALSVQQGFADTILWSQDGLLPDDVFVLMPRRRSAFALVNETVVTHGGPTLDEVVVPFVEVTQV